MGNAGGIAAHWECGEAREANMEDVDLVSNMQIWEAVRKVDPAYTKLTRIGGREFTAVDPQYRIQQMTALFGPCGAAWGYEAKPRELQVGMVLIAVVQVTLWYMVNGRGRCEVGTVTGACVLFDPEGKKEGARFNPHAYKSAETDALTKSMSRIGVAADVFLGMFDDAEYLNEVREEFKFQDEKYERAMQVIRSCWDLKALESHAKLCDGYVQSKPRRLSPEGYAALQYAIAEQKQMIYAREVAHEVAEGGGSSGGGETLPGIIASTG